jgi:hypothetical protein
MVAMSENDRFARFIVLPYISTVRNYPQLPGCLKLFFEGPKCTPKTPIRQKIGISGIAAFIGLRPKRRWRFLTIFARHDQTGTDFAKNGPPYTRVSNESHE